MIKRYCNVFILSILHCLNRVSQMAVTTDSGNICVVWCLFNFFCKCKHAAICNRTFMIDAAKETSPDPPTIPVIRWLNAINPEVFTEQAIRYTK